jgi:hypothetical protein
MILGKYNVSYFRCYNCLFIQTEEPYWLDEAYGLGAISSLDVGIMSRNVLLVNRTEKILGKIFSNLTDFSGVDYGGGHGIFVRMMRDLGFNFYRQDLYAENLYARYFDIEDLPEGFRFNILTAFEVFEHLSNPIEEIKTMLGFSDILLFSTELQPSHDLSELEKWWYIVPETGQHISFYNKITFQEIAIMFNVNYYTDNRSLHILSKTPLYKNPFFYLEKENKAKKNILQRIVSKINKKLNGVVTNRTFYDNPRSLTMVDFEFVKQKMKKELNIRITNMD